MNRDELLRQQRLKDEAIKAAMQKYKDPSGIKYDLCDDEGANAGYIEYNPKNDSACINACGEMAIIEGKVLKSLRDALNKLLDD
jgi:N-acetylneuraminic acid mutarotase